ncbi:MAG: glycosyl hydrolase, partial [Flavobacteriales bacterium]|nr:glycosyl hydrolase [Flavobacteriales bacterium]
PKSGIYESKDGGNSWTKISVDEKKFGDLSNGFPTGDNIGRIGLALHHNETSYKLYAFLDNQNKKEEEEKEEKDVLKKEIFQTMSKESFAALEDKKLESFLRDNGFPEEHTATSVKKGVADGSLKPSDLYDYLFEASAIFYEKPVIGAEVYSYDFDNRTWTRTHKEPLDDVVFSYGYYFGLIRAGGRDGDNVYIAGVPLITSDDGGITWKGINPENVHVDHHALWVNPDYPGHLINGSDGGIQISYDNGTTWVNCNTPAVGQFYTVAVDNAKPYNVYGGLQDNGVWVGPSTNEPDRNWYQSGKYPFNFLMGGDGMQVQVDTRDNETVYTGYQFGQYARLNRRDGWEQGIHPMHKLGEKPLRWNWQTPILLSKHHQDILYICSNKVHRSLDKGNTFETLSNDLTRGEKTGDVPFATLTSITESPLQFGLLAVGSDDGLVHISKDNGYTWLGIDYATTLKIPSSLWVSRIQFSSHKKERLYLSLNGYRNDHFTPYVLTSDDLGATWRLISSGLPTEPVNVIREDPTDEQLLYVGTDHGLYVSFDRGQSWSRLGNNMPDVPVHDLAIQSREKDLVVGTHGRSIWIGNLEEIEQYNDIKDSVLYVFEPDKIDHSDGWGGNWSKWLEPYEPDFSLPVYVKNAGTNATVEIWYHDSLLVHKFEVKELSAGFNYIDYDFSLSEQDAEKLEKEINAHLKEEESDIEIKKAENGRYYLAAGKYTLRVKAAGTERKRELVLE